MNNERIKLTVSKAPADKPLLIYDGQCGFCKRWVTRWQRQTRDLLDYEPYQTAKERFTEIPEVRFRKAVHFITTDGSVYDGAEAVFRSLAYPKSSSLLLWMSLHVPLFAWLAEHFYGFVARNRQLFSQLMNIFMGKDERFVSYKLSRFLFLRGLALVYFFAFLSVTLQWKGLIGSNGITPAADLMKAVNDQLGESAWYQFPTLLLLNSSDAVIQSFCIGGMVSSIFVFVGVCPALFLLINWVLYLSIINGDQTFLSFQWDILLLETGLLAVFYAPVRFLPSLSKLSEPPLLVRWMLYWLLFRLMYGSGFVKLASDDVTWQNLTALNFHYFTQPIPTWTSWYAHHLPEWCQAACVLIMFGIELALPFLILLRGWGRLTAFWGLVGLQILILCTGNYGFFNFLTIVLCLNLINDNQWRTVLPFAFLPQIQKPVPHSMIVTLRKWVVVPVCLVYLFLSVLVFSQQILRYPPPERIAPLFQINQAFRSINTYGLFAVMTTTRPEIIVEGSLDGEEWKPYIFKYKPVRLDEAPEFTGPHMPRLDWQMWFAALGSYERNRWLLQFMGKLMEGEEDVIALMKENPFADTPPKYTRAVVYDYEFTIAEEKAETGNWWKRSHRRMYSPVLTLKE